MAYQAGARYQHVHNSPKARTARFSSMQKHGSCSWSWRLSGMQASIYSIVACTLKCIVAGKQTGLHMCVVVRLPGYACRCTANGIEVAYIKVHIPPCKSTHCGSANIQTNHKVSHKQPPIHYALRHPARQYRLGRLNEQQAGVFMTCLTHVQPSPFVMQQQPNCC